MKLIKLAAIAGLTAIMSVSALAGIADTKHNLGASGATANGGGANPNFTTGTTEICVFCHTPHGGSSDAPLWNKNMPASGTFTPYTSTTMDGSAVLAGSPSLACLSCHDGQQAMDSMINAPSTSTSYNFDSTGAQTLATGVWTGNQTMANGAGDLVPMLGQDLSDDHPVAVPYAGGGLSFGNTTSTTFFDKDFNTVQEDTIGAMNVWWLDTAGGTAAARDKTDIILYTRSVTDANGTYDTGFVECASCHDPHVANPQFLRPTAGAGGNDGSQVCLACHNK